MSNDFSLEDLRPEEVMREYWRLRAQDLQLLIDPQSGALRRDIALHRDCPGCRAQDSALAFRKDGFDFVQCRGCTLTYVDPVPNETMLARWYSEASSQKWFEARALAQSMEVRTRAIFAPRLLEIAERRPERGRLLDVGCSRGYFLALARREGWQPFGVEIDAALAAETAARVECQTWAGRLETAQVPESHFDVVTLWEVLEHVIEPLELLAAIGRVLRPGGLLALSTPNYAGIEFGAVGPAHKNIDAPAHINYFTPSTLSLLLERAGFVDVDLATPGRLDLDNVLDAIGDSPTPGIGDRFLLQLAQAASYSAVREQIICVIQEEKWSGSMRILATKK